MSQERAKTWIVQEVEVESPACFLYTKAGYPPSITDDLLAELPASPLLLHLSFPDFFDQVDVISQHFKDIFHFIGLHDKEGKQNRASNCLFMMSGLDLLSVSILPSTEKEFIFDTPNGRKKLTPEKYVQVLQALKPNLAVQPFPEITAYSQKKRTAKSIKNSTQFARECLSIMQQQGEDNFCKLWPVVSGGAENDSRQVALNDFMATYESYKSLIGGVLIGGVGKGDTVETRRNVIKQCIKGLPTELPKMVTGLGNPLEVLDCVEQGIDFFTSTYPHAIAETGFAFSFSLDVNDKRQSFMNMRDKVYEEDWRPILGDVVVEGQSASIEGTPEANPDLYRCPCYCCRRHTRAYVHHLLNTHELLGLILLNIHNTHQYLSFFAKIREHIKNNSFTEFKSAFVTQWKYV